MTNFKQKYIGDKAFYKQIFVLVIPIIIQQGITNFVSLLDNIMVGGLGTASISAVAIVNQLIFVFYLTIFGGLAGASIFGAQFVGSGDIDGLKQTFRFKMIFGIVAALLAIVLFIFYGENLMLNFLSSDVSDPAQVAETLELGGQYLLVSLFGLIPFAISQTYSGTLRETGETVAPMVAGIISIFVNLILNYILIFGNFGAPELGVLGAGIATVTSRYVELAYLFIFTHRNAYKFTFIIGVYKSLYISKKLLKDIAITGSPLLVNEIFWSIGMTVINQSYSVRGLDVVAAVNITSTAWNLFCVMMFAMGAAVSIVVGQCLGAGEIEKAKDVDNKLLFFTLALNTVIGAVLFACAGLIPLLYNTEPQVRDLSAQLLRVAAFALPLHAVTHVIYFTLRAGGKTMITFLFDCVFVWVLPVPIAFILARYTDMSVVMIYFIIQFIDIGKLIIGIPLLRSGVWANNLTKK